MRVYAEGGRSSGLLLRLECDRTGCSATIRPHPEIAASGWIRIWVRKDGEITSWDYCPEHAAAAEGSAGLGAEALQESEL